MRKKGGELFLTGVFLAVMVLMYDFILDKSVNDITGPRSITALVIAALLMLWGIIVVIKENKKKAP